MCRGIGDRNGSFRAQGSGRHFVTSALTSTRNGRRAAREDCRGARSARSMLARRNRAPYAERLRAHEALRPRCSSPRRNLCRARGRPRGVRVRLVRDGIRATAQRPRRARRSQGLRRAGRARRARRGAHTRALLRADSIPDALGGISPSRIYTSTDAADAIARARVVFAFAARVIGQDPL